MLFSLSSITKSFSSFSLLCVQDGEALFDIKVADVVQREWRLNRQINSLNANVHLLCNPEQVIDE